MTRPRAIDEHVDALRSLEESGRLVDVPARTWCAEHDAPASPYCSGCAGDHRAGEHRNERPRRTCARCYPAPIPPITHTTHADRSTR